MLCVSKVKYSNMCGSTRSIKCRRHVEDKHESKCELCRIGRDPLLRRDAKRFKPFKDTVLKFADIFMTVVDNYRDMYTQHLDEKMQYIPKIKGIPYCNNVNRENRQHNLDVRKRDDDNRQKQRDNQLLDQYIKSLINALTKQGLLPGQAYSDSRYETDNYYVCPCGSPASIHIARMYCGCPAASGNHIRSNYDDAVRCVSCAVTRWGVNGPVIVPGDIKLVWFIPLMKTYNIHYLNVYRINNPHIDKFKEFLMTKMAKDELIRDGMSHTPLPRELVHIVGSYLY